MTRRARHLLPDSPERAERTGRGLARATPAARVLALQRQAGNRAVVALLARAPGAKAPVKPKAPATPKETYLIVPKLGMLPLRSFSWGVSGRAGPQAQINELTVTTELGDRSSALAQAVATGTSLGTVEIVLMKDGEPYARVKLHDALVSSYSMSNGDGTGKPVESWTLNAKSIKWEAIGGGAPDRGSDGYDRSAWHLDY